MDEYIRREDVLKGKKTGTFANGICLVAEPCVTVKYIESIEPADVVQVVHGKWKKIGMWGRVYRCNQCGNFLDFDGVNAGRGAANFCPNCGAKMDAQGEE